MVKIYQVTNLSTKTDALKIRKMQICQHNSCKFKKNQLIDLKEYLEIYVKTLPVFGFISGRYDWNLIKSSFIPYLIRDTQQETSVIKKASNFIYFKFGDVQFLDKIKFCGWNNYSGLFSQSL